MAIVAPLFASKRLSLPALFLICLGSSCDSAIDDCMIRGWRDVNGEGSKSTLCAERA